MERPGRHGVTTRGAGVRLEADTCQDSQQGDSAQLSAQSDGPSHVVCELVELLTSGVTGRRLVAELMERFGSASRFDVYLAVGVALSLWEADMAIAEGELASAERMLRRA